MIDVATAARILSRSRGQAWIRVAPNNERTMERVEVKPAILRWAVERAGASAPALARRFPRLDAWTG